MPRTNSRLFADVARCGVLLSEYGWLLPPAPWRFPARNRLIAALADAVVTVEGRHTSGALHTAAFALDLGRDVLAVPGEAGGRCRPGHIACCATAPTCASRPTTSSPFCRA